MGDASALADSALVLLLVSEDVASVMLELALASLFPVAVASAALVVETSTGNSAAITTAAMATRMTTISSLTTSLKSVVTTITNPTVMPTTTSTTSGEGDAEKLTFPSISFSLFDKDFV